MTTSKRLADLIAKMELAEMLDFEKARAIAEATFEEKLSTSDEASNQLDSDAWQLVTLWRSYLKNRFDLSQEEGEAYFFAFLRETQNSQSAFDLFQRFERLCTEHKIQLPTAAIQFLKKINTGELLRPSFGKRSKHQMRDHWVRVLVISFCQKGMSRYRNSAGGETSACDAVAEGFRMSYDAVAKTIKQIPPDQFKRISKPFVWPSN